jgi:hypothetical protein
MSRPAAAKREEHLLLAYPGRDIAVTAVTVVLTAAIFAAVASRGALVHIQRLDDAWLQLMVTHRSGPVTAVAEFLNFLGLVYITLPCGSPSPGSWPCAAGGGTWPRSRWPSPCRRP